MSARVLAIVVHHSGPEMTARCVRSLVGQSYPALSIILVDNSDAREAASAAQDAGAQYLPVANLGFAAGCNRGFDRAGADHDLVWLVNPDVVADADALSCLVRRTGEDAKLAAVASDLGPHDVATGTVHLWRGLATPARTDVPDFLSAASLLLRADALREIGGFDERFFLYWEDVDLCLRLRNAGWKLTCEPASKVHHDRGGSVGNRSPLQDYYATRSALLAVRKHAMALLPIAAAFVAGRSFVAKLARGELARLHAAARGYMDGLLGRTGLRRLW